MIYATLSNYSNGLSGIRGTEIEPHPPELVPAPYDFRDSTAVSISFEL
jgi:hypothetical protein